MTHCGWVYNYPFFYCSLQSSGSKGGEYYCSECRRKYEPSVLPNKEILTQKVKWFFSEFINGRVYHHPQNVSLSELKEFFMLSVNQLLFHRGPKWLMKIYCLCDISIHTASHSHSSPNEDHCHHHWGIVHSKTKRWNIKTWRRKSFLYSFPNSNSGSEILL